MDAPGGSSIRPEPDDTGRGRPEGSETRLTPLREMQLVDAHRQGDPDAIGELLRVYQRRIYGVCYRMVRTADEAADLTQDALVKVMEGLETYDGRSALSTWVIRVTMNCCLSHLRKESLRRHRSLDTTGPGDEDRWAANLPAAAELSPIRRVEQAERRAAVLRALGTVDPPMRAVLVLRDLQGLEYQQITEVLGIPVGTVKSRLFRARAALREATEQELTRSRRSRATETPDDV